MLAFLGQGHFSLENRATFVISLNFPNRHISGGGPRHFLCSTEKSSIKQYLELSYRYITSVHRLKFVHKRFVTKF